MNPLIQLRTRAWRRQHSVRFFPIRIALLKSWIRVGCLITILVTIAAAVWSATVESTGPVSVLTGNDKITRDPARKAPESRSTRCSTYDPEKERQASPARQGQHLRRRAVGAIRAVGVYGSVQISRMLSSSLTNQPRSPCNPMTGGWAPGFSGLFLRIILLMAGLAVSIRLTTSLARPNSSASLLPISSSIFRRHRTACSCGTRTQSR